MKIKVDDRFFDRKDPLGVGKMFYVRDVVCTTEKFSQTRHIRVVPPLRQRLRRYLTGPESPLVSGTTDPLLFPNPLVFSRPSPSFVVTTLRRLCKDAGIVPPFHPHQFRTMVVERMLSEGQSL